MPSGPPTQLSPPELSYHLADFLSPAFKIRLRRFLMGKFETGDEVFYIHNSYGELPEIRHGIVVDPPSGMEDTVYCSVRPIEHKNIAITTVLQKEGEVFLEKKGAYPLLIAVIEKRAAEQRKELQTSESYLQYIEDEFRKARNKG